MENFTKLKQAIDIMGQILPNYVHKKMLHIDHSLAI